MVERDLVVGIDSSTTATKVIAYRRDGTMEAAGRCAIPLENPGIGRYEQDPEDWWRSAVAALRELTAKVDAGRIAAVAISNQRETFAALDDAGRAVRPGIVWLDQRCGEEVGWLTGLVGAKRIHQISGKPPDLAPVAYRIAWMLRHEASLFGRAAKFVDVQGFLVERLTGTWRTSWASADPMGMFDLEGKRWSGEVMGALQIREDQLPEAVAPGSVLGTVTAAAASECSLREGTLVVAGGGDGQLAGLGVNALTASRAYLNLGTAVVSGTYSRAYRVGKAWRTMGDGSGSGYYYETSLRSGTFLIEWFVRQVCQAAEGDREIYARLEAEAVNVPAGSCGLMAVPYWGAVMTPYWDPAARGCFVGLTGAHGRGHLYRSILEGIALEQTMVSEMIEAETTSRIEEFVVIGGGAASELWCGILANASGKVIRRPATVEASSLGAAMCAAAGAGWFGDPREAASAMADPAVRVTEPVTADVAAYRECLAIYREIYPQLKSIYGKLSRMSGG